MAEQKAAKRRYTKADYEQAARYLAGSVIIQIGISGWIKDWIASKEEFAGRTDHPSDRLEVELLKAAWEREQVRRKSRGDCIDCARGRGHDMNCPRRNEAQP
jgi:hypothetical protein